MGHEDILLIPGDVSSSMERLEETLSDLTDRYDQVRPGEKGGIETGGF